MVAGTVFLLCEGVFKLFPNTSTDFIPCTIFHCKTVNHFKISHWEILFNACYLLMKSQIQAPNWNDCGSKLLRHLPHFAFQVTEFEDLRLSDAVISLFTCCFLFEMLRGNCSCILYSIMCWEILRYAYICVKKKKRKKYATCEEGTRGPEGLSYCWEADLCGLSSLSRMRITLWEFIS